MQLANTDRLRHLTFTFNGQLVIPLNSLQVRSISVSALPPNSLKWNGGNTSVITETALQEIKKMLLDQLQADEGMHSKIPVFGGICQGEFPYMVPLALNLAGKFSSLPLIHWHPVASFCNCSSLISQLEQRPQA